MAGNLLENLNGIGGLISGIGDAAKGIRAAITGKEVLSPDKQAEIEAKILEIEQKARDTEASLALGQIEIQKIEAASTNMFIAGARPAILWIGALVILYCYVVNPILVSCGVKAPEFNLGDLWPVITGILGLGTMRSYEKVNGAAGNH